MIASSACLAGEIPQLILAGKEPEAAERALLYRDIMGEGNFFLEIMSNTLPEQALVNKALVRLSRDTSIPISLRSPPAVSPTFWGHPRSCTTLNSIRISPESSTTTNYIEILDAAKTTTSLYRETLSRIGYSILFRRGATFHGW